MESVPTHDDDLTWVLGADHPERRQRPVRSAGSTSVLGAAMLAMGRILEPHNLHVEIQAEASQPGDDLPFRLDYGGLPPLD